MKKLAYVLSQFPEMHETFILREIVEMRKRGFDITVYSLKPCKDEIIHPEAEALLPHTVYAPFFASLRVWKAVGFWLLRRPVRFFTTFFRHVGMHLSDPQAAFKVLVLGPKLMYYAYLMRKEHARHIHAHWATIPASAAMIISDMLDLDWSLTAHAWDIFVKNPTLKEKIRRARFVFTCTEYNRRYLEGLVPEASSRILLMYHGVKLKQIERSLPKSGSHPLILSVGRLVETKGFPFLLHALSLLKKREVDFRCVIVGQGNCAALQSLARRLDIEDQVEFTGPLPRHDVQRLYGQAAVFALPCVVARNGDRDGIPNVIFESMSAGLPVVSTTVSGIPEAVIEGETGYLVPPKDPVAFVEALQKVLGDPKQAQAMGEAGRALVSKKFAEDYHMDLLVEAFRERLESIRRIRVLLMIWSLEVGGAERVVSLLGKHLDAERFDVRVACLNHRGALADELEKQGIPVHALQKRGALDFGFLLRLIRLIRREQIDLLHTHLWGANLWGRLAACWTHREVIVTEHSTDTWKKSWHFAIDRFLAPCSRFFIAVSSAVADYYQKRGIPKGMCRVIANGIDTQSFPAPERSALFDELGWDDSHCVFVAIGRFVSAKNQKVFVDALAQVIQKQPQVRGLLLGQGPLEAELRSQIDRLGLQEKVAMPGVRTDIPQILNGVRAVVFTSEREGLPMVLLEAMAAGVPVVSTPVGGVGEVLTDGENGWIIPEDDAQATAECLERLAADAETCRLAGQRAQERIRKHHSVEAMTAQHEVLYEQAVKPVKRVVHIIDNLHGGGAQQQLYELVRNLPREEWDPVVIVLTTERLQIAEQFIEAGIPIQCIAQKGKWSWSCFWELRRALRALKPDLVHTWLFTADMYGRLAARSLSLRPVISSVRSVLSDKPAHYVKVDRWLKRITDTFIVNANVIQPVLAEREGVGANKVITVHNGIDIDRFAAAEGAQEVRRELNLGDAPVIGLISRIMPVKDPGTFLKAAHLVIREMPEVRILVVGDGDLLDQLKSDVHQWQIEGNVVFAGYRPDRPQLLAAMDIVALSSLYEGCSNSILEAMAAGKPVVATNVGGNAELIREGKTGHLVPARDANAMAAAFKHLLRDPELRKTMGEAGRQRVSECFTLQHLVQKTEAVYRRLLNRRDSRMVDVN